MSSELQKRLTQQLKQKGLSITKLEDLAGVKRNIVRNILKGQSKKPTSKNLQALARALGCTMEGLLGEASSASPNTVFLDPKVFAQIVGQVLAIYEARKETPSFERVLNLLHEVYLYAATREPQGVDDKFIEWLIDQKGSRLLG